MKSFDWKSLEQWEYETKDLDISNPEDRLAFNTKMDATTLQFPWLNMPTGVVQTGRGKYGAGLYHQMMAEYARSKRKHPSQISRKIRKSILDKVIVRLQQEDDTDMTLLMMI